MNERIKELAKDSDLIRYDSDGNITQVEKFAELIIKDVIEKVWDEVFREFDVPQADRVKRHLMEQYGIE